MKRVMVSRRQILKGLVYSGAAALTGVPLPAFARGITRQIEGTDLLEVCLNGKYGFINHSGSLVIKPRFEATWGFTEGLACVKRDGKFGFIDQSGEFVIFPRFSYAGDFRDGRAAVNIDGGWGFIDKSSKVVIPPISETGVGFHEGLAAVKSDGKYGFIDTLGNVVIPLKYDKASRFSEGLAEVREGKYYGYINVTGDYVISPEFDAASPFSEGLADVVCSRSRYFIDRAGSQAFRDQVFNECDSFHEGYAGVKINGKWGFISKSGDIKINPVYDWVGNFSEGLAFVTLNIEKASCFGFVDSSGEMVIQPREYSMVSEFKKGIAWVTTGSSKCGYINRRGEYVWEPTQ